jgi:DNA processing protein
LDKFQVDLDTDLDYWIACTHIDGVGPSAMARLLEQAGTLRAAWTAEARTIRRALSRSAAEAFLDGRRRLEPAELGRAALTVCSAVVAVPDPRYPTLLKEAGRPPPVLFVRGDPALLSHEPLVSAVGARRMTRYGRRAAMRILGPAARQGIGVVSGLALGIDATAHETALNEGAPTIAVMACGPDIVYPARNRRLHARIVEHGAVVTEYPPGVPARPGRFPARNRIIAGLSKLTVVMEAAAKSGALITARYALDMNRDVLAVPSGIFDGSFAGCLELIKTGATPVTSVADLEAALDLAAVPVISHGTRRPPPAGAILEALEQRALTIDQLAQELSRPVAEVARTLVLLELDGAVVPLGGTRYGV